jgi:signal transduction histidine kinase
MSGEYSPPQHSLRSRLLLLSGATFLVCAGVIILFFPLLNITLENLLERSTAQMRETKETEALTIARLLVLEFSQKRELLEARPGEKDQVDQSIMNLIWQKVTFNEVIEGIELICDKSDARGRRLTYLFYRREAPDLKPMSGPEKLMKQFHGAEKKLLDGFNTPESIDKEKLEVSVNLGPKKEGQMLLRYLPVYVLVPEEGAVFWGVAKIGIDLSGLTAVQALQEEEQNYLRRAIWLEIVLSLFISGILAVSLLYLWARSLTEPLLALSEAARDFKSTQPPEYDLWLDNLRRIDPRGQTEVSELKETLLRLGHGVHRLGERLFSNEYQACLSRILARGLAAQSPREAPGNKETSEDQTSRDLPPELQTELADWQHFASGPEGEWQTFDPASPLRRAWRLVKLGLPPRARARLEVNSLPRVWGSPGYFAQAVLLLLDYAAGILSADGELTCQAGPLPGGGLRVLITVSGPEFTPENCQALLRPPKEKKHFAGPLGPALAAAIVHWHGGELAAQPEEPRGLRFTLTLPPPPPGQKDGPSPG